MTPAEIKALMAELAPVIRDFTDSALRPLREQIAGLAGVVTALKAEAERLSTGLDGVQSVEVRLTEHATSMRAEVETLGKTLAQLPQPKDGADGMSVSIDNVMPALQSQVAEFLASIPIPKDGERGEKGAPGRDGLDVKDLFRAEGGRLVAVMSDGTTKDLGVFVGKDGARGSDGVDGKDGAPGKDGRDGFSLEAFDANVMEDGRTVLLSFDKGDFAYAVELGFPVMIYRGVFRDGETYERGDTVTWGGSLWHCDAASTTDKPDGGAKHWTLAAKRGRDGKDGEVKAAVAAQPISVGVPAKDARRG